MKTKLNNLKLYFWRGLYRTLISIEIRLHKFDLWVYNKVDYKFFVKSKSKEFIGVSRQPFRSRNR